MLNQKYRILFYLCFLLYSCADNSIKSEIEVQSLVIITLTEGETLNADSTYSIEWESENVESIDIHFSKNGGTDWEFIETELPAEQKIYEWKVPNILAENAVLKIVDASNDSIYSKTKIFSIINSEVDSPYLLITFPIADETLNADSTYSIEWESENVESIDIHFSKNGGADWEFIETGFPAEQKIYEWKVPNILAENAVLKIVDASNDSIYSKTKIFSIIYSEVDSPYLLITFPIADETLIADSTYSIEWETEKVESIDIHFSNNGGADWEFIETGLPAEQKIYEWKVPNILAENAVLKIHNSYDPSIQNISDIFAINYSSFVLSDALSYYPSNVGNVWIYNINHSHNYEPGSYDYYVRKEVVRDTLLSSIRYFLIRETSTIFDSTMLDVMQPYYSARWEIVDSKDGYLKIPYKLDNFPSPFIDLKMKKGDFWTNGKDQGTAWYEVECVDIKQLLILGISTEVKKYRTRDAFQSYAYDFAKNIGSIRSKQNGEMFNFELSLKGAIINGEVIGDTTITK